jgi:hypothetical protein
LTNPDRLLSSPHAVTSNQHGFLKEEGQGWTALRTSRNTPSGPLNGTFSSNSCSAPPERVRVPRANFAANAWGVLVVLLVVPSLPRQRINNLNSTNYPRLWGCHMLALLGLTLAWILVVAFILAQLRSSGSGVTLSNGLDVLVGPEMYEEIVQRYRRSDELDPWERWDHAVLDVIRPERPLEWRFLARSLGQRLPVRGRRRETVNA